MLATLRSVYGLSMKATEKCLASSTTSGNRWQQEHRQVVCSRRRRCKWQTWK